MDVKTSSGDDHSSTVSEADRQIGGAQPHDGMVWLPGGTFRMGSDRFYPEEAPVHRVTLDGFWIDPYPVTNAVFRRFVEATGYVTFAEIPPNPKDYPNAPPEMLKAGSSVFVSPPGRVPCGTTPTGGSSCPAPTGGTRTARPGSLEGLDDHPVVHVTFRDAEAYARWAGKQLPTEAGGSSPPAAGWTTPNSPGATGRRRAGG